MVWNKTTKLDEDQTLEGLRKAEEGCLSGVEPGGWVEAACCSRSEGRFIGLCTLKGRRTSWEELGSHVVGSPAAWLMGGLSRGSLKRA